VLPSGFGEDKTMTFASILAQNSAISTLKRALKTGKTAHAYLFFGPPGVGKQMAAFEFSKALNCRDALEDGCDRCNDCRKITKAVHPDVFKVTLRENRKTIPVESIRELERRLSVRPHEGQAKVVIIDPADKMTESAANALLKTLEEPGPGRYLILITDRLSSLLPTVRSRCQLVRFNALPEEIIIEILTQSGRSPAEAMTAAALAGGSMVRAFAYLDDEVVDRVLRILDFIHATVDKTPLQGLEIIEQFKQGRSKIREEALAFLALAPTILSELLWILTHGKTDSEERPLVRHFGDRLFELSNHLTPAKIASLTFALHHAEQSMLNNNMNPQLAFEGVLAAMRSPFQKVDSGSGFIRS
jgi:DNA polymerase-3 subunit delta'